jgi:hypothetical protein
MPTTSSEGGDEHRPRRHGFLAYADVSRPGWVLARDHLGPPLREREHMDQARLNRLRAEDRAELVELLEALNGAANSLRRDECGDQTIFGSRGHIRACDGTFSIYVCCRSARQWTFAKRQMVFCQVGQDGDDEGILRLARLPTSNEAEVIRRYIGLHQTRQVSPEQARWLHPTPLQKARSSQNIAVNEMEGW